MTRIRLLTRLASAAAIGAALASCNSTELTTASGDRVLPSVIVTIQAVRSPGSTADSVNVRLPLQVVIQASDNASLASVITQVFVDGAPFRTDSMVFTSASATFEKTLSIPLAGVNGGQQVTVRAVATDNGGNQAVATAAATAFDPNVPRVRLVSPDAAVIPGGTYTVTVRGDDSLGVLKLGYRTTGLGAVHADSVVRSVPLKTTDSVAFSLQIPSTVAAGTSFTIQPFAENVVGLRANGVSATVRVVAAGPDLLSPLVFQTIQARAERGDTLSFTARDPDGLVRIIGYALKDSAGHVLYQSADTLAVPQQQISHLKLFTPPITLRGRGLFVTGFATDVAGHTGFALPAGSTLAVTADSLAKRDPIIYAFGQTTSLPVGSLGADIAVDTLRQTVYVSNLNRNELEVFRYGTTLSPLAPVAVGSMPWGMTVDNSGSLLLVANSGGTNISRVDLTQRTEVGRVKTTNEYVFDVEYSVKDSTGFKYKVTGPIDYSDRPQYLAQSASGAIYYSTLPTTTATPGTLRRIDNFLDPRPEPKQIWQYGSQLRGHWVILNADNVGSIDGGPNNPDILVICDHPQGQLPSTSQCFSSPFVPTVLQGLQGIGANTVGVQDLDVASLALPDTNFVAAGGDRRRVAFGEAHTGARAGRVLVVFDSSGTPAGSEEYSAPIQVADLTNNASDLVFGLAINGNSTNIAVHGIETFFADTTLRLQGKYATFNSGAGVAFHPRNDTEVPTDLSARVVFVASGDQSIQIVDSYDYRLRGRVPLRANLYGPLRAVLPTAGELAADPTLVVKVFGLTPQGLIVVDIRASDIDNVVNPTLGGAVRR